MSRYAPNELNMQKVREREDIEDGYIYLERVPYKSKRDRDGPNANTAKASPKPLAPSPKVLPNTIAIKPNEQPAPLTNTSRDSPQQTFLKMAFTSICNRATVFACQAVMGIFVTVHEVAAKVAKAGAAVYNKMATSGADDAGNTIHGGTSHHKDATPAMGHFSAADFISINNIQLSSREEDDFVILDTLAHDPHDEDDFVMIDASPADEDDDFTMVDAVPWAKPPPTSAIRLPGRTSLRFLVHRLI